MSNVVNVEKIGAEISKIVLHTIVGSKHHHHHLNLGDNKPTKTTKFCNRLQDTTARELISESDTVMQ
jgi:hypothetical protein